MDVSHRCGKIQFAPAFFLLLALNSCALLEHPGSYGAEELRETAGLIQDVKAFGRTLGIEPTDALTRTTKEGAALSLLWVWLQKTGTLALNRAIDIRMAVGFSSIKEQTKIEQVYRVEGYSVYYRQGNEFADSRSVATASFAAEGVVRKVKVILHEDLHGDNNFDLSWEVEEGIVTPLGSLAAIEFFRRKGDRANAKMASAALDEERKLSRELNELLAQADTIFNSFSPEDAKKTVLDLMASYPNYRRQFQRQTQGQHPGTALEAKLSHDAAYYRHFERIADLSDKIGDLATLIAELKKIPRGATLRSVDKQLEELEQKFTAAMR